MPTDEEIAAQKAAEEAAAKEAADKEAAGPTAEELAAEKARLEAQAKSLEEQAATIAAAQAALAPPAPARRTYADRLQGVKSWAGRDDDVAAMVLEQDRALKVLAAPENLRQDIVDEFVRGGYEDVNEARRVVEGRKAQESVKSLAEENEKLKAQLAAAQKERNNAVPGATAREGPAPPDTSKPLSEDEWDQLNAGLSREDRRANQKLLNQGKITIKG